MDKATTELRDAMLQYTTCADPTESAARKERLRQAEEQGEFEETARNMAKEACRQQVKDTPRLEESPKRVPALLRLGPSPTQDEYPETQPVLRRKPGRPPGKNKVANSPLKLITSGARKRKVQQAKPLSCRRRTSTKPGPAASSSRDSHPKTGTSRGGNTRRSSPQSSDNQPLCNMVPAMTKKKKKTDFHNSSAPVP